MMYIRIDINDREIGHIGVHNTQEYDGMYVKYDVYDLRGYTPGDTLDDHPRIMEIWHDRGDDALGLTERVASELDGEEVLDD